MKRLINSIMIMIMMVCCLSAAPLPAADTARAQQLTTTDLSGNAQVYFSPGDSVRITVSYSLESPRSLVFLNGRVQGQGVSERLVWQFGFLPAGQFSTVWDLVVPPDAEGRVEIAVNYIGLVDELSSLDGYFVVTDEAEAPENVGSEVCVFCHGDISRNLEDSRHGFIDCETCHGPGSLHAETGSPDFIEINTKSSFCGACHTRGDKQNRVAAEDGLIKSNQQYDELLRGGKPGFKCVRCHDPHISLRLNPQEALKARCSSCHIESINQMHSASGVDCVDCHMPLAVFKEDAVGDGDHLRGDSPSHLFSIDPDSRPTDMFYGDGGAIYTNGFLTLNFTCLGCHDGTTAKEREFNWAQQAVGLIHSN